MARNIFQGHARDGMGRVIEDASITVYLAGTTTLATIYEQASGGSAVSGSVVETDASGFFYFYIDDSDYADSQKFKVVMSKTNFTPQTYDNLMVLEADGTNFADLTLSNLSNVATARTNLGITSTGEALITASNAAAVQQALSLEVGVDVQTFIASSETTLRTTLNALPFPDADNEYEGPTVEVDANGSFSFGEMAYIDSNGNAAHASSTSNATMPAHLMCVEATLASGATGTFLLGGMVKDGSWSWTVGTDNPIWMGSGAGDITQTVPSTSGRMAQVLGWPLSSTVLHFAPSADYLEVE